MKKHQNRDEHEALDLERAERELRDSLLRLYYVRTKLCAEGGADQPAVAEELARLERRSQEIISLWASVRRERALARAEREVANVVLDRLRVELDTRTAERTLRRELGNL